MYPILKAPTSLLLPRLVAPFFRGANGGFCDAFSLVEVVIALGIASFALVLLLALLPAGVNNFRQTINTTMASQISQRVFNDLQIGDFDNITSTNRFFDEQGNELTNSNSTFCTYWVQVRIATNATTNATTYTGYTSQNLYTATVLVALNPGGTLAGSNVWTSTNPNTITYSSLIGHN